MFLQNRCLSFVAGSTNTVFQRRRGSVAGSYEGINGRTRLNRRYYRPLNSSGGLTIEISTNKLIAVIGGLWVALLMSAGVRADFYDLHYSAKLLPKRGTAEVVIKVDKNKGRLRQITMQADPKRYTAFEGDGSVRYRGGQLTWDLPAKGGDLRYVVTINARREGGYDSKITQRWALLRFEDLFPSMGSRTKTGARSKATLQVHVPEGWSLETRYGREMGQPVVVETKGRRLDRPTGWMLGGLLGVRRTEVQGHEVTVAAPEGSKYPRVPMLAFLRWTLPAFIEAIPELPEQVLIVSGDETMWRGALSGPNAFYIHPQRPLISENATSTILHELVHLATRWQASPGDDWIVEGIAEFYGLEILRRSGGISEQRYLSSLEKLSAWAKRENATLAHPSKGADTAHATLLFAELHQELTRAQAGGLDLVVQELLRQSGSQRLALISRAQLLSATQKVLGHESQVLTAALEEGKPAP